MAGDVRLSNRSSMAEDMLKGNNKEFASYDVFISHRGPDTKIGFVSFLRKDLVAVGLRTFLDCNSIDIGDDCWQCIEHTIKRTSIVVVVFSKSFAQSEWCLRELHVMLHTPSVTVLPVFYNVQPWEVRFPEKGQLKEGFEKLCEKLCGPQSKEIIDQWREDLGQASKLMGWEHFGVGKRLEGDLVKAIVRKVLELANKPLLVDVGEYVVGVEEAAVEILQVLEEKERVLMLGLWGMGGIGKSTLARVLYNQMRNKFDASCFIEDVQAKVRQGGMERVQDQILRKMCKNESMKIEDKLEGKSLLEMRVSSIKFLLVLDNVGEDVDMYYCLSREMLGNNSKCIVTTRDAHVIKSVGGINVNDEVHIHEVKGLSDVDSQRVFASFAFGNYWSVKEGFEEMVARACRACCGVPLVLKVFGALLRHREDVEIWEDVVMKLERGMIMNESRRIFECLEISYNMLEENVKEMFLDIACVMLGESKDHAILVWKSQGYCATLGVQRLVEKALISIDGKGCFNMHDHLRDMGREIVKRESMCTGVTKRLWMPESLELLKEKEILRWESISQLFSKLWEGKEVCFNTCESISQLFSKLWEGKEELSKSLQCLMIHANDGLIELDVSHAEDLRVFTCHSVVIMRPGISRNLRWFIGSIDSHLKIPQTNKLAILNLQGSKFKTLDKSVIHASELEVINLGSCCMLTSLPRSFGSLKKLRDINLGKSGIESLPESFGELSSLEVLNMRSCSKLTSLPRSFGSLKKLREIFLGESRIESLPESFGELSSLEVLNMYYCEKLTSLPNSFGCLKKLRYINLGVSKIESLPESFGELSNLEGMDMEDCYKLTSLSDSFGSLKKLRNINLAKSGIERLPKSFGELSSLKVLNMNRCKNLISLPNSFGSLKKLREIKLGHSGIWRFRESFGKLSSLEVLDMCFRSKLTFLPDSFGSLKKLRFIYLGESKIGSLPESFGELSSLEVLSMGYCYSLTSLPRSFGRLKKLQVIELNESWIESLPESFGELSSLEVLDMSCCYKLTSLPNSFGSLKKLRVIDLHQSEIESLPESFGELSSLEVLDMRYCRKLTSLPDSFGSLKKLRVIDLHQSEIESLPESFGELSSLEVLNVRSCSRLTSPLDSFGSLKKIPCISLEVSRISKLARVVW